MTAMYSGIRNYQIIDKSDRGEDTNLVEIGPRMVTPTFLCVLSRLLLPHNYWRLIMHESYVNLKVLIPIRIFNGSLGGATLYQNPTFVTPNEQRSQTKKYKG